MVACGKLWLASPKNYTLILRSRKLYKTKENDINRLTGKIVTPMIADMTSAATCMPRADGV
jgi:hypothetical protein